MDRAPGDNFRARTDRAQDRYVAFGKYNRLTGADWILQQQGRGFWLGPPAFSVRSEQVCNDVRL